jgi:hypothetical protein
MSQKTDDDFKSALEKSRAGREEKAIAMEFAGFPCKVLPLPRIFFISAGQMPDYLTRKVVERLDRTEQTEGLQVTAEQIVVGEDFRRAAVCRVLVSPRVVSLGEVPAGGYLYADLLDDAPAFISAVFLWIMSDCPLPAEEKGEGVLGVEDLANFPDSAAGQRGAKSGAKGARRGKAAVRADAPDRKRTRRG